MAVKTEVKKSEYNLSKFGWKVITIKLENQQIMDKKTYQVINMKWNKNYGSQN